MHTAPFGHGAVYDPGTLRALGLVFDNAWASLAHNFDSGSSERARLRLASIILEFASAAEVREISKKDPASHPTRRSRAQDAHRHHPVTSITADATTAVQ